MKAQAMFFTVLFAFDAFFGGYFVGFNSRHVLVEDPSLPRYKPPAAVTSASNTTKTPPKPTIKPAPPAKGESKGANKENKDKTAADKKQGSNKDKHNEKAPAASSKEKASTHGKPDKEKAKEK